MATSHLEAAYPRTFRGEDARLLGEHIKLRHIVELIGAKRVGISNFLRFFLYHKDIIPTYISTGQHHVFIPVDLNDLVERDVFPFWILTFKRLVDAAEHNGLDGKIQKKISSLFLDAIQSQNLFLTIENLRSALITLAEESVLPTFFFIRFDRLKDTVTEQLLANLEGLREATGQKASYVFTSFRMIEELVPHILPRHLLSVIVPQYVKPATSQDMKVMYETFETHYSLPKNKEIEDELIHLSGGHVQYLHFALIILSQKRERVLPRDLFQSLVQDERITLQSEEIWDSLEKDEQDILLKVVSGKDISEGEQAKGKYLTDTGLTNSDGKIFSPLFEYFVKHQESGVEAPSEVADLTKKEHLLFTYLLEHVGEVCEREHIIDAVWPEYAEYGVSDWTIDRLTARLRTKLKGQKSRYSIVTVKTRGYKLIEE